MDMRHFDHVPVRPFLLQMGNLADARAVVQWHYGLKPDGRYVNGPRTGMFNRMAVRYMVSTRRCNNGRLRRCKGRFGRSSQSLSGN
jgi:hypothetical protein